jgi:DNA-binding HxlR family transcriptional regulator
MSIERPRSHESCLAVREVLHRVGDKWSVLVVNLLSDDRKRFSDLRRSIEGISQRMLTLTLKALERDGLVTRTVHPTIPPRVEYELTELGRTLLVPVSGLAEWAQVNRGAIQKARTEYDARDADRGSAAERPQTRPSAAERPQTRPSAAERPQTRPSAADRESSPRLTEAGRALPAKRAPAR